ncbi:hypothetical protein HLH33_06495 [Gluconacetobacter diazotrophicus]|uniref:Uncharacterized protein n=1 Tax=Gluconacetobacter diazotrophicus TaxID=33996 RepID=A0A7W4I4A9_GLUDI|nr:hypothetical protein [Gluconacetobacter diazotrophicus]MBB2155958.1 hypothetical protein [Gluconacetobacter diazotrophicus]
MRARILPLVLLLAGCAGGKAVAPQDETLAQAMESGRQSVALDRLSVAESQYRLAGTRAVARDDAPAIGDAGYNLAVVQLAQDRPADALSTVAATRGALALRGHGGGDAELDLVQAAALYRLSRDAEAAPLAASAMASPDPATTEQAALLGGLIADARGDRATLAAAAARLAHTRPVPAKWQADEDELRARMVLATDPATARDLARHAADLRQGIVDYRGMARALTLAARAAGQAGDAQGAAALSLQAAQSMKAQGVKGRDVKGQGMQPVITGPDPFATPSGT